MAETLDLSMFVEPGAAGASHMTLAVEGVACAGCIRKIESGLTKLPGVIDARLNFTQRRLAVDWRNDEIDAAADHRGDRSDRLSRPSVRARTRRSRRQRAGQVAAEMPRGRRLRRDERDVAVGLDLGRQRLRHDAGDARSVPLALRPDRAAGGGLCRPAVLSKRTASAAGAAAQYGRADFARRDAGARPVVCSRPRRTRRTPISIPRSCCCSFCCAAAISIWRCGARRGCLPAISPASRRNSRTGSIQAANSSRYRPPRCIPATACWCGPGERIPADGTVINGASDIDESLVTGETLHRAVRGGMTIYAGSINVSGALTMRVTALRRRYAGR